MNAEDANDFHEVELNITLWTLRKKYSSLKHIGSGAFGQVSSAKDSTENSVVAIKKLTRPFQSFEHAKRTYREIKLLTFINHDNVIKLLDIYSPVKTYEEFKDAYLVFPYIGYDLHSHIRASNLPPEHIQLIAYQVVRALKFTHSAGIIHRDLKPSNIVVSPDLEVKLIDFGLARLVNEEMSGYVATRWYRAPEVLFNWMHYGILADMWSVGCILAEMLTSHVFLPGKNYMDQLELTFQTLGTPGPELHSKLNSSAAMYLETLPKYEGKDFAFLFPDADQQSIDLLQNLLVVDPDKRLTAEQTLAHAYFCLLSDPDDEPSSPPFADPNETGAQDIESCRKLVWQLIQERTH